MATDFIEVPIINTTFLLILVWYLGYYSLSQEKITYNIHEHNIPQKEERDHNLCATKEYHDLKIKLNVVMKEREFYKLEQVNLSILAEQLDSTDKKTSYLLNQCMNTTFYDLINEFRLEEFKSKITKGEFRKKTILALAFESGFNSKATFNRIFKQKEGISPSQFVKDRKSEIK